MGKRQAEKQLTDRNCDDPEADDTPLTGGMKAASPQAISKRSIRALPGRSISKLPSAGASKFGSLPSNPQSSWSSFGQVSQPDKSATNNLFGTPSNFDTKKPSLFGSSSAMASNLGSNFDKPKCRDPLAVTRYYTSLRGLNEAIPKLFQDLIKKDTFRDLGESFDRLKTQYNQHRSKIQSEYERATSSSTQKDQVDSSLPNNAPAVTPFSFHANGVDKASKDNPAAAKSTPFQTNFPPSSDNSTKSSLFSAANGSAPQNSKTNPIPNPFATATPKRSSPLRNENQDTAAGNPTESSDPTSKTKSNVTSIEDKKPAASLFSAGFAADHKPKPEEKSANSVTAPPPASAITETKPSLFGMPSATSSSTSAFGSIAPKPFSFGSPQAQNSASKPPSIGFGFGVAGSTNGSVFGGFGTQKSHAPQATPPKNGFNPVGFSFGNSPPASSAFSGKTPDPVGSEKKSVTDDSASSSITKPDASASDPPIKTEDIDDPATTEQPSAIAASTKGEEDEETLYETTGRVYALIDKKGDDGKIAKGWVGWAVCNVKLNRHKQTKKTRILARSQVNQGILINFLIRPELKPENRGKSLELLGFNPEGTHLQAYRIRPSTEEIVKEFIDAIKQAVQSL